MYRRSTLRLQQQAAPFLSSMLETLISSKTRVKLLLKFFLNPASKSYLRGLESEFGESTNAIRMELNRFEEAGLLNSAMEGNKKMFGANTKHPLFSPLQNLIRSYVGIDHLIENVIENLGDVKAVYLTGDLARGIESHIIDLIIIGNKIDQIYLTKLTKKAESFLKRKIRHAVYGVEEWESLDYDDDRLLVYSR
jgi:hypothetical protein